jgi:zinc transporter, ZIP family
MNGFVTMLLYTTFAGLCILIGGVSARFERIRPKWLEDELRHSVIAFGGGVLISAVALVLVPEGSKLVPSNWGGSLLLVAGGLAFFAVERYLGLRRRGKPQFLAMLLDYLPESIALGGMFAVGAESAPVLAVLTGLQNLPEAFNAYRELDAQPKANSRRILWQMCATIPLGPVAGALGWIHASEHTQLLGAVMLFSSGGILYLLFQDVAPQSHLNRHWGPALGAVLGFAVSMLAQLIFTPA